ncbi:hypothetical protein, partial [Leptospira borgpetersenii]|uniref:hypothetical protein n=1 Tax=Leptospira borgpetersenii TaxID=174 RepID=UPI001D150A2A
VDSGINGFVIVNIFQLQNGYILVPDFGLQVIVYTNHSVDIFTASPRTCGVVSTPKIKAGSGKPEYRLKS